VRSAFLTLLFSAAPLFAVQPAATILSYHQVLSPEESIADSEEAGRYTISVRQFEAELDDLQQNGFHVIPLSTLADYVAGRIASMPPKAVVITVDDGWQCTYNDIFPELQRRRMPFTVFIFPSIIGSGRDYLTWPEVEEMSRAGVDIEDHTYTHAMLTRPAQMSADEYDRFLQHQLIDSRSEIEKHTGRPVRFIAYPYSMYDAAVQDAVQRAGYEAALYDREYGARIGRGTPMMHFKRFPIESATTLEKFRTFLPRDADSGGGALPASSGRGGR
jgi:peptidoglycan/xylan/chitin deacetylase (PgdA/CDA1 family)